MKPPAHFQVHSRSMRLTQEVDERWTKKKYNLFLSPLQFKRRKKRKNEYFESIHKLQNNATKKKFFFFAKHLSSRVVKYFHFTAYLWHHGISLRKFHTHLKVARVAKQLVSNAVKMLMDLRNIFSMMKTPVWNVWKLPKISLAELLILKRLQLFCVFKLNNLLHQMY